MTRWRKRYDEGSTLGPKNKMSMQTVVALISVVIYFTGWFFRMEYRMDAAMTKDQFQQWKDEAWNQNRVAYPGFVWPPVPAKQSANLLFNPTIATKE